jgi:hypothetical protein
MAAVLSEVCIQAAAPSEGAKRFARCWGYYEQSKRGYNLEFARWCFLRC